jgi:anti-anti-sigma factor
LKTITGDVFEIEQKDDTLIVVRAMDLRELDHQRIEKGAREILDRLNGTGIKNVILDFGKTDYYGSTAINFFLRLWSMVRRRNGRMAFYNVSDHQKEILHVMRLDHLWPICSSRSEAAEVIKE